MDRNDLKAEKIFTQAIQSQKENNFKVAEKLYKKILKKHPNHLQSINLLGLLSLQTKNFEQAKQLFNKSLEINPKDSHIHNNLGIVLEKLEEPQKSIQCFQKAIEIEPNYSAGHNNLGLAFQEIGENESAIKCFKKAIEIQPNYASAHNNLGIAFKKIGKHENAISCYQKGLELNPNSIAAQTNISNIYTVRLDNFEKAIDESHKTLKMHYNSLKFIQKIPLYRLKHDVQQAEYLSSKNYKINGIKEFLKTGNKILKHRENKDYSDQAIGLNKDEINSLLPFLTADHIYQTPKISTSCINPHKNWQNVEDQYFNSPNQIIYIDNFLSNEAIKELHKFCLVSKVWNQEYNNKYLGAFSEKGFISTVHLQTAIELQQKLPRLFGKHNLDKFWGFKYDSTLGKGINIHADFAMVNLNFWITPDEYNIDKNSGGLKVYDAAAPDDWTFQRYNRHTKEIYKFLSDKKANCINVPYKFNRAVLFNSSYFHETDKINFKEGYETRRINITYLFGTRLIKKTGVKI